MLVPMQYIWVAAGLVPGLTQITRKKTGFWRPSITRIHGCRLYMTVNTLVKKEELDQLYDFLKPYYERGLDAVIVQDLGVWKFIREHFPDLPIHASTQMTVTGWRSAKILKRDGCYPRSNGERIIPSGDCADSRPCGCGD